ncbi:hypothetical protein KSP40_PGU007115 [Platanthera guangdongensis]|uniref:CSC1/OSCA1-like 7TM region domain-containing protein n=1 Tax=Platanthera guangdongensis TaxID=2320717 RepID=A0ABR2M468_9ASPA
MIICGDGKKTIQVLFDERSSKSMTAEGCQFNASQLTSLLFNSHETSNELLSSKSVCISQGKGPFVIHCTLRPLNISCVVTVHSRLQTSGTCFDYFIKKHRLPKTIGIAIPQKATFFITYVMVDGWAGVAGEILRLKPLIIYHIKNLFFCVTIPFLGSSMLLSLEILLCGLEDAEVDYYLTKIEMIPF